MTIPTYKEIMPELLKLANNVDTFKVYDFITPLSDTFKLSDEEKKAWYASKNTTVFTDRSSWAKSYLKMTGLVKPIKTGVFKITPNGKEALKLTNEKIIELVTNSMKERNSNIKQKETITEPIKNDLTPDEMMENGYNQIKENLQNELLDKIISMSPEFFEVLVVKLLVGMGYGGSIKEAGQAIGRTNDEGIDGIIKEDTLGLEVIYIQAKRWQSTVGRPEIQKFAGALLGKKARKGIFITTSNYSTGALEYANNSDIKIILINGEDLTSYMVDYNIGVSKVSTFDIKTIDTDFFEGE